MLMSLDVTCNQLSAFVENMRQLRTLEVLLASSNKIQVTMHQVLS
jgi:hypothetical protein